MCRRRIGHESAHVVGQDRFRQPGPDIGLAPRLQFAQGVERQTRRHGRQPRARIANLGRVRAAPTQPRFLHDIFRGRHLAQHAIGDACQMRAMRFEGCDVGHAALRGASRIVIVTSDTTMLEHVTPWPRPRLSAG